MKASGLSPGKTLKLGWCFSIVLRWSQEEGPFLDQELLASDFLHQKTGCNFCYIIVFLPSLSRQFHSNHIPREDSESRHVAWNVAWLSISKNGHLSKLRKVALFHRGNPFMGPTAELRAFCWQHYASWRIKSFFPSITASTKVPFQAAWIHAPLSYPCL